MKECEQLTFITPAERQTNRETSLRLRERLLTMYANPVFNQEQAMR